MFYKVQRIVFCQLLFLLQNMVKAILWNLWSIRNLRFLKDKFVVNVYGARPSKRGSSGDERHLQEPLEDYLFILLSFFWIYHVFSLDTCFREYWWIGDTTCHRFFVFIPCLPLNLLQLAMSYLKCEILILSTLILHIISPMTLLGLYLSN